MAKKELYDFDAVTKKLNGLKWIVNSNNVQLVALFPIGDGKVRILTDGLMVRKTRLNNGFNRSREFLKSEMEGCDYYYDIADKPETLEIRKELINNRILVDIDDYGIGTIEGKVNDDALNYSPNSLVVNPSKLDISKIVTFYEYNPAIESPSFGETCELINTTESIDGSPIWRKVPKILQNQSGADYAERALKKGVRTVVEINDKELDKIIPKLEKEGKLDNLKEFTLVPGLGNDFIVESDSRLISKEVNKIV